MSDAAKSATDRFGHPIDPIVGYARGPILASTDEEVRRMLEARHMVGARVRSHGADGVYDLSGMNRGAELTEAEVPHVLRTLRGQDRAARAEAHGRRSAAPQGSHREPMPGSAPVLRLMMYPDGARLGVERIAASVENALGKLGDVVNDVVAVREKLLG